MYCFTFYGTVLYCIIVYCNVLCYSILCCTVLKCIVLYYVVSYCIVLYCIVLYCIELCYLTCKSLVQNLARTHTNIERALNAGPHFCNLQCFANKLENTPYIC